ncbi:ParA family protein [Sulfitobacter sp. F26204]|uniref:ParA family protein n=1 Tax=Sulfitobacter sp. F26204 TaxID=2996014 RepID=UPI00225DDE5E|nr:ParA family protein [Sulfitobacter sp. F26204]MCX7561837.1 ParA family protein [Sulfitobacter sp. F26204]
MPTIVVASPKGGAGKSTTAVLLGTELANGGVSVTMLDCDPNGSLTLWAERGELPDGITVLSDISEADIVRTIKAHDSDGKVVVVDLEGVASRLVSRAISQADLVLTPMRATTLDATIGARALQLIAEEEEALDRTIPHAVVFTMTKAIQSKQHKGIAVSLKEQGVDVIDPPLMERAAFSGIFAFGGDLHSMPPQGNMQGARDNARAFAMQVYKRLTGEI